MNKFDVISRDLFNKIRGRFESVTIGDENGQVTNVPEEARYFDFDFVADSVSLGKVSVSLDPKEGLAVIVARDFVDNQAESSQDNWYNFLKELRFFAKKRMLKFDVRDINKSNLSKRDYNYLSTNRNEENPMAESKIYGTNKTSFQKIGNAKVTIKHSAPIGEGENRLKNISSIFVETPEGEKFKYPVKHLQGARALALHVSEGGHAFDDFGRYITGLSEELASLGKFKTYMNRKSVMAEALSEYMDIVNNRVKDVKKEIANLQKYTYYKETFENFVSPVLEDVPTDIEDAWVEQLTVKQFNEELKDVFPYIYNLIGNGIIEEIGPDNLNIQSIEKKKNTTFNNIEETLNDMFETAIEKLMGQFSDINEGHMAGYQNYHCKDCGCQMHNCKEGCDCPHDSHDETGSWWVDKNGNGVPDALESDDDTMDVKVGPQGMEPMDQPQQPKKEKTPIGEFILSYFDRENGTFPKGETAVLTMVEKDYGPQYVEPAAKFMQKVESMVAQRQAEEIAQSRYPETERVKALAGLS